MPWNTRKSRHPAALAGTFLWVLYLTAHPAPTDSDRPGSPLDAEIRPYHGAPTLFLGGVPHSGMMSAGFTISNQMIFTNMGVTVYMPISTASAGFWETPVWLSADVFDYKVLLDRLRTITAASGRNRALIRLEISAPAWWREKYPGELVQVLGTNGVAEPLLLPLEGDRNRKYGARTVPSWASRRWLEDTGFAIRNLIREIEAGPYGPAVIGYMICSGTSHEWFEWASKVDVSRPNVEAFRRWLADRYGDEASLGRAWRSPVKFAEALPPAEKEVNASRFENLRDPARERPVIDYLAFLSDRTGLAVDTLCAEVKKASSRKVLSGAFYGYISTSDPRWGHQAFDRIIRSPNIDFLSAPTLYWQHRKLGVAAPGPMVPLGSLALHGKYWISETDVRTSLTGGGADWFQAKVSNIDGDIILQRREMASILTAGLGQWWFDVGGIRYDAPPLIRELSNLVAVADRCLALSRAREESAVAIIDPRSACYFRPNDPRLNESRRLQVDQLLRSGFASAVYSSGDLAQIHDRKLFLFCDMAAPDSGMRRTIDALKGGWRVLVFIGAAGALSSNGVSEQGMEALTGIRLRRLSRAESGGIRLGDCGGRAPELSGSEYGAKKDSDPVFVGDDAAAEIWGRLAGGEAALLVKRFGDWTAVYSSAPTVPAGVLAALGRLAGIHAYLPAGDAVWASREILGVHAFQAGLKMLAFPKRVRLRELYEGKDWGVGTNFTVPFEQYTTRLFSKVEE